MSKSKIIKIIACVFLAILLVIMLSQITFAVDFDIKEKFSNAHDNSMASQNVASIFGTLINLFQVIGTGVAVVMLVVLGIQYVWASPTGRAEFVKKMRVYIFGAIILFAAVGLVTIIKNFANKNINQQV